MDCYISVFQCLSPHSDEITEKKKKKKEQNQQRIPKGKENSLSSPKSIFWNNTQVEISLFCLGN